MGIIHLRSAAKRTPFAANPKSAERNAQNAGSSNELEHLDIIRNRQWLMVFRFHFNDSIWSTHYEKKIRKKIP